MNFINELKSVDEKSIIEFGGKANYLWKMSKLGINIPKSVIISFPKVWKQNMDEYVAMEQIEQFVKRQFDDSSRLIVRSSYECEDSFEHSFAGKFKSIVIRDISELQNAIRDVWASAGENWTNMGVVIQKYIDADYAGILFSTSPLESEKDFIIEFTQGSCSKLAEGTVSPDTFTETKGWLKEKPSYVEDAILHQVCQTMQFLKQKFQFQIDVEFCVENNHLYILQCRPITTKKRNNIDFSIDSFDGEWVLFDELSEPFTPLIRTMDPSGMLSQRTHQCLRDYVYFKNDMQFLEKKDDEDNWKDWEYIQKHYMDEFSKIQNESCDGKLKERLDSGIFLFRQLVSVYMNSNWFRYRGQVHMELLAKIGKTHKNTEEILLQVLSSVPTINTQKRKDFVDLVKAMDCADFSEKKEEFIRKYGFETSRPFYILCRNLSEYLDEMLMEAKNKALNEDSVCDQNFRTFYDCSDETTRKLIDDYRAIIQRTEDDDYLLSFGAYVIRSIIDEIGKSLSLKKEEIYYLTYDELKSVLQDDGVNTSLLEQIQERKKAFQLSKLYDMPTCIKDNRFLYSERKDNRKSIEGTPVSSGVVKGKIFNLVNFGDISEILSIPQGSIVYCKNLSPLLSSYFFNIKGLILAETSVLSHGAILAREMGIPAIGGISCNLKNGTMVEINTIKGNITIIAE